MVKLCEKKGPHYCTALVDKSLKNINKKLKGDKSSWKKIFNPFQTIILQTIMSVHNHYIGINVNSIQYYFTCKFIAGAERMDLSGLRSFLFENLNGKLDLKEI